MIFSEPQLQDCYESSLTAARGLPPDVREVSALIGVHDVFRMIEGPHSPRVHEAIEHLLSPALRPELRRWYGRAGADQDLAAVELRDHLSRLAGESVGGPCDS